MLERFYENKDAITLLLNGELDDSDDESDSEETLYNEALEFEEQDELNDSLEFSKKDWKQIEGMLKILKPVHESTWFVECRSTNAGQIIPLLKLIELELVTEPKTELFPSVRKAIVDGLNRRMKGNFITFE